MHSKITVVGINHRSAPVEVRERLAFREDELAAVLEILKSDAGAMEAIVLSTCNRVEAAVSISYAAVELAREIFGSLKGKTVLIAGAGKMSELAARHLHRSGATNIMVTNRTQSRADDMARLFGGKVIEYEKFHATLPAI